jgi:Iron-containing redox enzyme
MVSVAPVVRQHIASQAGLPRPRGPITDRLIASLRGHPRHLAWSVARSEADDEDDLHLALYCCYELHYQGFPDVDPDWEWEPSLLAVRRQLEDRFLADLQAMVGPVGDDAAAVIARLWQMATDGDGPSLSGWVADHATLDQVRELAIQRSAYQLKEADPHTWGIPRLTGQAKAAMVAIQADEYGNGAAAGMHATLFADTMAALDLDPILNRYLDQIPGVTLATTNLISMLGLHRRWRGALVGHLALFEMTSIGPMSRYAHGLRRLGVADGGCQFYDVHVEADQIHQYVAADGMVAGLLRDDPDLARDIIFGAACLAAVEARFSRHVLERWQAGRSSLRRTNG